jgi:hypothetical protein
MASHRPATHIVQLPFPSLSTPHDRVVSYYREYGRVFSEFVDGFFVPEAGLWELPLWVAHLAGMLESLGCVPRLIDLTCTAPEAHTCFTAVLAQSEPGDTVLLSPLAQNFDLCVSVSRRLMESGRVTLLGGNMTSLAAAGDATVIHHGQATPHSLEAALHGRDQQVVRFAGRRETATWLPSYRLLERYRGTVPLLRLNASHGCLYACDFCGDGWSRRLVVVAPEVLEYEVEQFDRLFPDVRLIYIGDKTFGQSKEAVRNLLKLFSDRRGYRFIVQTHILAIDDDLLDVMEQLGVIVVELGFESASIELLRAHRKPHLTLADFSERIARVNARGMRVVLNVLSGLPGETRQDHERTLDFIEGARSNAWLYNLYNFVPYPLTPLYPGLRDRIVDWTFAHWREDGPPVFLPYHVTRQESFQFFLEKVESAHHAVLRSRAAFTRDPLVTGVGC